MYLWSSYRDIFKEPNMVVLLLSQVFGFAAATVSIFLGGIVGASLSDGALYATLPVSMYQLGQASGSPGAAVLMSRLGRRAGSMLGSSLGVCMALFASYAVWKHAFLLYVVASFGTGISISFVQQYRFAAAESVTVELAPFAVSTLFLAGIVSSIVGVNTVTVARDWVSVPYVGSYLSLAIISFIPIVFLFFYQNKVVGIDADQVDGHASGAQDMGSLRGYASIITDPLLVSTILIASTGYGMMSFLMTVTPMNMHHMHGYSLSFTGVVIQMHVMGMFLPSLVTGAMIKRFGDTKMLSAGLIIYLFTVLIGWFPPSSVTYTLGMIALGVGWNFLFITSTTKLAVISRGVSRFRVQGVNDFFVFLLTACASFMAGSLVRTFSWGQLHTLCVPLLVLIGMCIRWGAKHMK